MFACRGAIHRCVVASAFVLILWVAPSLAIEHEIWICTNGGSAVWGDDSDPGHRTYWEDMVWCPCSFGELSVCDLDAANAYSGRAWMFEVYFSAWHWWAEVWLANTQSPVTARRVDAELWVEGFPPGQRLATASVTVTNGSPAAKYVFDFGTQTIAAFPATVVLKIIYYGSSVDTQIYWNHETCATGLYGEGESLGVVPATWGTIKAFYKN